MPLGPTPPEVLAPAGTREAMEAAVQAGADAVYFGLQQFNARARAANFEVSELPELMRWLHRAGVKGYVTLNTLVFDAELPALMETLQACAQAGVDALIVQDLGVMTLAHQAFPELPLHASTQMTCTDVSSVEFARELGASRVVLARELSLEEIASVKNATDMPLEVFVHGALCIAYSGQCLTSEALGGRSANRGACAQACRLPYDLLVDDKLVELGNKSFLLSPMDLDAADLVPKLADLGVRSLKIEGRLKGPEYVASTTRLYRNAVDSLALENASLDAPAVAGQSHRAELRTLSHSSFSRGSGTGFLAGVNHQALVDGETCDHRGLELGRVVGVRERGRFFEVSITSAFALHLGDGVLISGEKANHHEVGGRVWAMEVGGKPAEAANANDTVWFHLGPERPLRRVEVGRRVFLTHSPRLQKQIEEEQRTLGRRHTLNFTLEGEFGTPLRLTATSSHGGTATVPFSAPLERANKTPTTREQVLGALGRLGETPYHLGELTWLVPEGALIPLSQINEARRALVPQLLSNTDLPRPKRDVAYANTRLAEALAQPIAAPPLPPQASGLFVLCRTLEQARAALAAGAAGVYLDFLELKGCAAAVLALRSEGAAWVGVAPPRIRKPNEGKLDGYLRNLKPEGFLVRGLGTLRELQALPKTENTPMFVGDFSLNLTNRVSVAKALSFGLSAFTPSFDLDEQQLLTYLGELAPYAELVLHHPMPLFHMEHCVYAALLSNGADYKTCGRPCDRHKVKLRDRIGLDHPVEADVGCRNTVFHAQAQSAAALVPRLQALGVHRFRMELVQESPEQTHELVETYAALLRSQLRPEELRQKLKAKLGYGVVSGSLRVISNA
ncbi:MAG: U32 family peptidase [Polyangiaceae bacterium]|nr:U32 family peptidase [Polyangiaceae bacterium]